VTFPFMSPHNAMFSTIERWSVLLTNILIDQNPDHIFHTVSDKKDSLSLSYSYIWLQLITFYLLCTFKMYVIDLIKCSNAIANNYVNLRMYMLKRIVSMANMTKHTLYILMLPQQAYGNSHTLSTFIIHCGIDFQLNVHNAS